MSDGTGYVFEESIIRLVTADVWLRACCRLAVAFCVVGVTATGNVYAADSAVPSTDNSAPSTSTLNDRWSVVLNSEVRTFSWKSNLSYPASIADNRFRGSGTQVYVPYAMQVVGLPTDVLKIEVLGRGGWVSSRQTVGALMGQRKKL